MHDIVRISFHKSQTSQSLTKLIDGPAQLLLQQRKCPFLHVQNKLILCGNR